MKKRVLSIFMALVMCLSLLPTAAFAAAEEEPHDHSVDAEVLAVQELIDALPSPDSVTAADYDAVQDAYDAYDSLTGAQQAQITGAEVFRALFDWFNSQTAAVDDIELCEHMDGKHSTKFNWGFCTICKKMCPHKDISGESCIDNDPTSEDWGRCSLCCGRCLHMNEDFTALTLDTDNKCTICGRSCYHGSAAMTSNGPELSSTIDRGTGKCTVCGADCIHVAPSSLLYGSTDPYYRGGYCEYCGAECPHTQGITAGRGTCIHCGKQIKNLKLEAYDNTGSSTTTYFGNTFSELLYNMQTSDSFSGPANTFTLFVPMTESGGITLSNSAAINLNDKTLTADLTVGGSGKRFELQKGTLAGTLTAQSGDLTLYGTVTVTGKVTLASGVNAAFEQGATLKGGVETAGANLKSVLPEGTAFAKQSADGAYDIIVDSSAESITDAVRIVAHTTHTFGTDDKCACGASCPHENVSALDGICTDCDYQMPAQRYTGNDTTHWGTTFSELTGKPGGSANTYTLYGDVTESTDTTLNLGSATIVFYSDETDGNYTLTANIDNGTNPLTFSGTGTLNGSLTGGSLHFSEGAVMTVTGLVTITSAPGGVAVPTGKFPIGTTLQGGVTTSLDSLQSILPDGAAFAKQSADGAYNIIVDSSTTSINASVKVVAHAEHTFGTNGKCTCGETAAVSLTKTTGGASVTLFYPDLAAAAAAGFNDGDTLKLLKNVLCEAWTFDSASAETITLDLNAKLLTSSKSDCVITIASGHHLTLANSAESTGIFVGSLTVNGTLTVGKDTNVEINAVTVNAGGTLTVDEDTDLVIGGLAVTGGEVELKSGKYNQISVTADGMTVGSLLNANYGFRQAEAETPTWHDWHSTAAGLHSTYEVKVLPLGSLSLSVWDGSSSSLSYGYSDTACNLFALYTSTGATAAFTWYEVLGTDATGLYAAGNRIEGETGQFCCVPTGKGVTAEGYSWYLGCEATLDGYTLRSDPVAVTVSRASLSSSVKPDFAQNLTFTGAAQVLVTGDDGISTYYPGCKVYCSLDKTSWIGKDQFSIITGYEADTYTIYWYVTGSDNYNGIGSQSDPKKATVTIAPKKITIVPQAVGKTYGETDPTLTYTTDPALTYGSDLYDAFHMNLTGALSRAAGEGVNTYDITLGNLSAGSNFELALPTTAVQFTISAKAADSLTASAPDQVAVVGTYAFSDPVVTGVNNDGALEGTLTYSCGDQTGLTHAQVVELLRGKSIGDVVTLDYQFTPTSTNYSGSKTGSFKITVRDIEFFVNGAAASADNAITSLTEDTTYGKTWAQRISVNSAAITASVAGTAVTGTYTLYPASGSLTDRPAAGTRNYTVKFTSTDGAYTDVEVFTGSITVTKKPVTLVGVKATDRDYDGTDTITFTYISLDGMLEGDAVAAVTGIGTVEDPNAGSGKAVTLSQNFTLTGTYKDNYTLSQPTGLTVTIRQKEITPQFTANNKTYDGTTGAAVNTVSFTGLVGEETLSSSDYTITAAFPDKNAGNNKTVTATVTLSSSGTAANYTLSTTAPTAQANITPKSVTAEVTVADKACDGTKNAVVTAEINPSHLCTGDTVTITGLTGTFASADKGRHTVTIDSSNASITGADKDNYDVTIPATAKGNIVEAAVSVTVGTGTSATTSYYAYFSGALAAANAVPAGQDVTITMQKRDLTYSEAIDPGNPTVTRDMTIDLNGCTDMTLDNEALVITNNSTVTITDSRQDSRPNFTCPLVVKSGSTLRTGAFIAKEVRVEAGGAAALGEGFYCDKITNLNPNETVFDLLAENCGYRITTGAIGTTVWVLEAGATLEKPEGAAYPINVARYPFTGVTLTAAQNSVVYQAATRPTLTASLANVRTTNTDVTYQWYIAESESAVFSGTALRTYEGNAAGDSFTFPEKPVGVYYVGCTASQESLIKRSNVIKITVTRAAPTVTNAAATVTYGQTPAGSDIRATTSVPGTFQWVNMASYGDVSAAPKTFYADFTPTDTRNFAPLTAIPVSVTVNKADPPAPANLKGLKGNTLATVTLPEGWSWVSPATVMSTAGSQNYPAKYTDQTGNYNDQASMNIPVLVAEKQLQVLTVSMGEASGWTYHETPVSPTYDCPDNAANLSVQYKAADADGSKYTSDVPTNAGSYTVRVSFETASELWVGTVNFSIKRARMTGVSVEQNGKLTYTGMPQAAAVTTTGTTVDGQPVTYTYSTTEGSGYGAMPTFTNAGSYTVYFKAAAENHLAELGRFTVVIGKATPTITNAAATVTYGQTPAGSDITAQTGGVAGTFAWSSLSTYGNASAAPKIFYAGFTPTDTDNYNTVANIAVSVTVNKADYTGSKTAEGSARYGLSGTADLSGCIAPDGTAAYDSVIDSSGVLNGTPTVSGTTLSYSLNDSAALAGKTAVINVKVTSPNHADYTIAVTITVDDKDVQAPLTITSGTAVVYNKTLALTASGGSGSGAVTFEVVPGGTGSAAISGSTLTATGAGTVKIKAVKAGDNQYAPVESAVVEITVSKAAPTGTPNYTPIRTSGKTLGDAALTVGSITPAGGTIVWDNGDSQTVAANTAYTWTYTPADQDNYSTLTGSITPYVLTFIDAPSPSVIIPVSSGSVSVKVSASVSGGTASVKISEKQLDTVISGGADNVTVDVSSLTNADSVKLNSGTVKQISSAAGVSLTAALPGGAVSLDDAALASVAAGRDVTISVRRVPATDLTTAQQKAVGDLSRIGLVVDVEVLVGGVRQSSFNGGKLTISIPYTPKRGEDVSTLTVWFIRDDGSIENMGGHYDAANQCFVFETTHLSRYVLVNAGETQSFSDVSPEAYYAAAVSWAAQNNITGGIGGGLFAPDQTCSRAQIVTFLWRAAGSPEPKSTANPFTDVSPDAYYYKAVLWAVEQGITIGTSDTTFSPDANCTRAQAVTFIYRSEKAAGGGFTGAWMFRLPFTDVPEWCFEAVAWCCMNQITTGTSDTTFSPDADCTRAQIVTFLYRADSSK